MNEPYDIKILPFIKYLKYQIKMFGLKRMLGLTESGYPRFFALGYCDHKRKEIVICKNFFNRNLLYHEIGHEIGLNHSPDRKNVMYPYFWRGSDGITEIIDMYSQKYSRKKFIENVIEGCTNER